MKKSNFSLLCKIIYVGVILLFIFLYTKAVEISTYNIDGLKVKKVTSLEHSLMPKKIKSLDISYKGIEIPISFVSPVSVISDDNIKRTSSVKNVNILDHSMNITLNDNVIINLILEDKGQTLKIEGKIPKVFPTIKEIILPIKLLDTYGIERGDLSYKITSSNDEFHLKLNDKYFFDDKNLIHILAEDDKVPTLTFSPLKNNDLPLPEQWYMFNRQVKSESLESTISSYLTLAEKSINNTYDPIKLDPENNLWINIPKIGKISERSIIVYLSQAMKKGQYSSSLEKIKTLKKYFPSIFTYASTPYLGDIVKNGDEGITNYRRELSKIKKNIQTSDKKLFEETIPSYYFDSNDIDTKKLEMIIVNYELESLNLFGLVASLENLLNIYDSKKSDGSVLTLTELILKKMAWDDSGLYITNENSVADQSLNLKIGQLLIRSSKYESNEYAKTIGEALISTYLQNRDETGNISKSYDLKSRTFSSETIPLEDTFLALSSTTYLPHYFSKDGITIWTISNSIEVDKSDSQVKIVVSYPRDINTKINSHFLTIIGVNPYKQLYYKGTLWRADRVFERYGVGYYYDNSSQILFFMPNHSNTKEEILINY